MTAKADAAKAARAQAAQEGAEREADLMWSRCASCGQERLLDRPITEPGALYMPHVVFLPQPHAAGELPLRREQCQGSLAPATPVAPFFSHIDTGAG